MVTVPRLGHPGAGKSRNTAKSASRVAPRGCRTDCAQGGGEQCGGGSSTTCFSSLMTGPGQQPSTDQHEESENPNPSLSLLGCVPDICASPICVPEDELKLEKSHSALLLREISTGLLLFPRAGC